MENLQAYLYASRGMQPIDRSQAKKSHAVAEPELGYLSANDISSEQFLQNEINPGEVLQSIYCEIKELPE